jgi:nucleotide-binding universal stress UspA family protein
MEPIVFFFAVGAAWVAIGLVASYVMGRRGHNPFGWWFLGAVFGPLVIFLAIDAARRSRLESVVVGQGGMPGEGSVDVLVGIDGSPQSEAALVSVCRLLGPRLGRLTVAGVVTFEAAERAGGDRAEAEESLARAARSVTICTPETVILSGPPARALVEHAGAQGYDLVAVGSRGRGASKRILGSVSAQLVRQADVPVLVAGGAG